MDGIKSVDQKVSVIGVVPQYSECSKYNIYTHIKMPPVGIISILTQMGADPRFGEIYALDENNYGGPRDAKGLPDHARLRQSQRLGLPGIAMFYGGMSNSIPRMLALAGQYHRAGVLTVAGGSHSDALPEESLRAGIDIVVHGEGEDTVAEIMDVILRSGQARMDYQGLQAVKGISFLGPDGRMVSTTKREPLKDLDRLRVPDLTLIRYLEAPWSAIPIARGRGCNWNCEFCTVKNLYGPHKIASLNKVMEQIARNSDLGFNGFFFTDDNFAQNPRATIELCKAIGDFRKEFKRPISLTVQVRSEIADNDELIEAMKYAGVDILAIGYETPIDEELKGMRKDVTRGQLVARSRKLAAHFHLHGMFIFGYPAFKDSAFRSKLSLGKRARETARFFKQARIHTIQVLNAIPLPGTKFRDLLEAEGRLLPLSQVGWDKYGGNYLCYDPTPEGLDARELQQLPFMLMDSWYRGDLLNRAVNFGHWMDWILNTVEFPLRFGWYAAKRFFWNLAEKRRARKRLPKLLPRLLPRRNLLWGSLALGLADIRHDWINLAIKTVGSGIVRKAQKVAKQSRHHAVLDTLTKKTRLAH